MIRPIVAGYVEFDHNLNTNKVGARDVKEGLDVFKVVEGLLKVDSRDLEDATFAAYAVGDSTAREDEAVAESGVTVGVKLEHCAGIGLDHGTESCIGEHVASTSKPGIFVCFWIRIHG